ncbi:MAG: glycosyltransferase [Lapillicoccus sp.]
MGRSERPEPGEAPIRVLQSFGRPGPRTNPYIVMLGERLESTPGLELVRFSWRAALGGHYDVVHLHWPEVLLEGASPLRSAGKRVAFALLLARLGTRCTPVVRTVHNLDLPTDLSPLDRGLLVWAERLTTVRIRLNESTPVPSQALAVTIPHGDYQDWFGRYAPSTQRQGRLAFVGLVRRYKGVERLLEAFADTSSDRPDLTLTVSGRPSTAELEADLRMRAERDPRVVLDLRFLTDAELVRAVTESSLVVLPYRFMHNSGTVLAALSLGRPVLAPRTTVNEELSSEVGAGWVHLFDGELTGQDLRNTVRRLADHPPTAPPNLTARRWDDTGSAHRDAYRLAMARARSAHPRRLR